MSAAFTPGPWDAGSRVVNSGGMEFTPIDAPEYAVAFVPVSKAANAHLIAAAPELYEALEVARGEIARVHQLRSALPQIDAALAKARGEVA